MSTEGGTKAVVAALTANLGIAVAKFVAFGLTGSSSMLSEAIHSLADSGNQVLLLVGGKRAKRVADDQHQFGYGRTRYVYAFVVSIVLFCLGGLFSIYEGWHKIQAPEPLTDARVAFAVLIIAILLESWSFRTAVREANRTRGSRSLLRFVRDARQPELPVVLLEDFGALIGLVFALIGVTLAVVTGDGRWDGAGALAIGSLLLVIAVFLALEMSSMLVGESAIPEQTEAIRSSASTASAMPSPRGRRISPAASRRPSSNTPSAGRAASATSRSWSRSSISARCTQAPTRFWSRPRSRYVTTTPPLRSPLPSTGRSAGSVSRSRKRAGSTSSPTCTAPRPRKARSSRRFALRRDVRQNGAVLAVPSPA